MSYLSWDKDENARPIAIHKDGNRAKVLYTTKNMGERRSVDNVLDYVKEKTLTSIVKKLTPEMIKYVENGLRTNTTPSHPECAIAYESILSLIGDKPNREIKEETGKFTIYPMRNDILYLIGATGSGKSTSVKNYLIEFRKLYPEVKKIFLFTDNHEPDPALEGLPIKKIKLDMKIVEKPIEPHELKNSVCIFDDVDSISDKKIYNAVTTLKGSVCKQGVSKEGITCIITNHSCTEGLSTKHIIDNSKYIVIYPDSGTSGYEYLFKKKLGFSKEQYDKIMSFRDSHSVWIHKRAPCSVISENGVFLL
jgi:hypothetical protein